MKNVLRPTLGLAMLMALPVLNAQQATPSPLQWQKLVKTKTTNGTLTKTAGCDGCCDAAAFAPKEIRANGSIQVISTETDSNRFIGLLNKKSKFLKDIEKSPVRSYDGLDFSLYFTTGGYVEVRENGIYRTDRTYGQGDVFSIAAVGNVIHYKKNGETFYESTATPVFPLDVGALMLSLKGTLNSVSVVEGSKK